MSVLSGAGWHIRPAKVRSSEPKNKGLYWEELSDDEEPEELEPEAVKTEAFDEAWSFFQQEMANHASSDTGLADILAGDQDGDRKVEVVFTLGATPRHAVALDFSRPLKQIKQVFIQGLLGDIESAARNASVSDRESSASGTSSEDEEDWTGQRDRKRVCDVEAVIDWVTQFDKRFREPVIFSLTNLDSEKISIILRACVSLTERLRGLRLVLLTAQRLSLEEMLENDIVAHIRIRSVDEAETDKRIRQKAVELFSSGFDKYGFRWEQAGSYFHRRRLKLSGVMKLGFFALKHICFDHPLGALFHEDVLTTGEHRILLKRLCRNSPSVREKLVQLVKVKKRDVDVLKKNEVDVGKLAEILTQEKANGQYWFRTIGKLGTALDEELLAPDMLGALLDGLEQSLRGFRGFKLGPYMQATSKLLEIVFNEVETQFDSPFIWSRFWKTRRSVEAEEDTQLQFACALLTAEYLGVIRLPRTEKETGAKFRRTLYGADLVVPE